LGKLLRELAESVGARVEGDGTVEIDSAAPIESAGPGQISFVANEKYAKHLETTAASAVVLHFNQKSSHPAILRHDNPYFAFANILDILYRDISTLPPGLHPTAVISESASVGQECTVGALTHVGPESHIADNCVIFPQVYIGAKVEIGRGCKIFPGVIIMDDTKIGDNTAIHGGTVIGADGFGYARHNLGIKKIKQIGWVEIGHDVEIGANCAVDRGALGPTRIGNHVKIDNLVQIAHNVEIGDYSIIVSQVGISGSTKIGQSVILAGQVGLVGHIEIGDGVTVAAQSGVTQDISPGKTFFGSPAREKMEAMRIEACLSRLPDLFKRVRDLEKAVQSDQKDQPPPE